MANIDKMKADGTFLTLSKRERLQVDRQRMKLEKNLGSIADISRLPAAMFIVDINREHIAVNEARTLNIPIFAMVDTNTDPALVDFPVPANDDAARAIRLYCDAVATAATKGNVNAKVAKGVDLGAEVEPAAEPALVEEAAPVAEEAAPAAEEAPAEAPAAEA